MLQFFTGITLIDITNTEVKYGNSYQRDQERNWETVLQVLSLKTQPIIKEGPVKIENINFSESTEVRKYFGEFYNGVHTVWGFTFYSEHSDVYSLEQLYQDFDQVPIILGLDETARFMLPIFHSNGVLKNIHFFTSNELNIL